MILSKYALYFVAQQMLGCFFFFFKIDLKRTSSSVWWMCHIWAAVVSFLFGISIVQNTGCSPALTVNQVRPTLMFVYSQLCMLLLRPAALSDRCVFHIPDILSLSHWRLRPAPSLTRTYLYASWDWSARRRKPKPQIMQQKFFTAPINSCPSFCLLAAFGFVFPDQRSSWRNRGVTIFSAHSFRSYGASRWSRMCVCVCGYSFCFVCH